jgi:signal transduction histidine kinase
MTSTRWWDIAVAGATAVSVVLLVANGVEGPRLVAALIVLAVYVIAWVVIGRSAMCDRKRTVVYVAILAILTGLATFIHPSLATVQTITYPLVWMLLPTLRRAILGNIAVAIAVGIGYAFSFGLTADSAGEAAIVVALSLTFSLAMGVWISRIFDVSTERQRLVDELTAAQSSLAALSRDAGVTSERERLAREIHDTIAQDLTGLVLLTQQARRMVAAADLDGADRQLALLEESARLALTETRTLVATSSPPALDDGIAPAIERLGARFERETGVTVSVRTDVTAPLDRATEVVLLRCSQEGLANIRKHSAATVATVVLIATDHGTTLEISDDGSGFDPEDPGEGYGLSGMRDRLALVDGALDVSSSPAGTRLIITLPAEPVGTRLESSAE